MPRGNQRGRGRGRGQPRLINRVMRNLRADEHGVVVDPGSRPSSHTIGPWIQLICEIGDTKALVLTPNLIANTLRKQHGFFVKVDTTVHNVPIDVRISGFKVWALNANRPIGLTVFDPRSRNSDVLRQMISWPAYSSFPRLGFWVPKFMSEYVFDDSDTETKVFQVQCKTNESWLAYVYCFVRSSNSESISASLTSYEALLNVGF